MRNATAQADGTCSPETLVPVLRRFAEAKSDGTVQVRATSHLEKTA
jgi:hypothetical protein